MSSSNASFGEGNPLKGTARLIEGEESSRFQAWTPPGVLTPEAEEVQLQQEAVAEQSRQEAEAQQQQREVEEIATLEAIDALQPPTAEEIEQLQQQAWQEGFDQGKEEGTAAGAEEVRGQIAQIEEIVRALEQPLATIDDEVGEYVIALAVAVARQVIRRELHSDPD
ncbi:MAG: hypothetical protein HQL48_09210, partial [Gammaproteobacteria bacterium]|nr:hypothetical protein [Gammaproteobacteria bacterium]